MAKSVHKTVTTPSAPNSRTFRLAAGKHCRGAASRIGHKKLHLGSRNFDPIEKLVSSQEGRLSELLPTKYARMSASPFAFFRGAVSIMAADFGRLPHSGIEVQLCGDAHVQNLGSFAAPDGRIVFDFNDFDETIRGPWEWDVKRMASSIILAGRESNHNGAYCEQAAQAFLDCYFRFIKEFSRLPILQVARHQIHREQRAVAISAALRQSQRATPCDAMKKFTELDSHGKRRFRDGRPVFWRASTEDANMVRSSMESYRASLQPEALRVFNLFEPLDVGFKVVGTGSVGLRDYIVLFLGNGPDDPLFLQFKQEMPSAYAKYLPSSSSFQNEGKRAAEGQRAIQPLSDLLLGWTSFGGHDYLVRQLNDHKGSIELDRLRGGGLESLAEIAGELMARGHARSGDACLIAGYSGSGTKLTKAITEFAAQYADLNEADYVLFQKAIKDGTIKVASTSN